jgi:hypothetical protein
MGLLDFFKKRKNQDLSDEIKLHIAGATVRHSNPFEELNSYINRVEISQSFREKWVIPFYFELNNQSNEWIEKMIQLKPNISDDVILQNLGDFDWRTRSTGAYFASIMNKTEYTDIIGTHLLKSEVCYAGSQYAITLASFNTNKATEYLNKYLDYYLKRTELDFDQTQAMSAIKYLDQLNGTNYSELHTNQWNEFRQSKINNIKKSIQEFNIQNAEGMAEAYEGSLKFWQDEITPKPIIEAIHTIERIKNSS